MKYIISQSVSIAELLSNRYAMRQLNFPEWSFDDESSEGTIIPATPSPKRPFLSGNYKYIHRHTHI